MEKPVLLKCWVHNSSQMIMWDFLWYHFTRHWAVLSCSVVSDSLRPRGLQPAWFLCPWDSPDKNTGVGCHALLQGIFPTQGSNPGLPHCRWILYHLSHQGRRRLWLQPFSLQMMRVSFSVLFHALYPRTYMMNSYLSLIPGNTFVSIDACVCYLLSRKQQSLRPNMLLFWA